MRKYNRASNTDIDNNTDNISIETIRRQLAVKTGCTDMQRIQWFEVDEDGVFVRYTDATPQPAWGWTPVYREHVVLDNFDMWWWTDYYVAAMPPSVYEGIRSEIFLTCSTGHGLSNHGSWLMSILENVFEGQEKYIIGHDWGGLEMCGLEPYVL